MAQSREGAKSGETRGDGGANVLSRKRARAREGAKGAKLGETGGAARMNLAQWREGAKGAKKTGGWRLFDAQGRKALEWGMAARNSLRR